MKKIVSFLCLAVVLCSSFSFTGCASAGSGGAEAIDENKTQLYVSNYDGGVGQAWLDSIEKKFEEANKNVCFEPGTDKKGVQIIVTPNESSGNTLADGIAGSPDEVFFAETVPYYYLVEQNLIADITDVVTSAPAPGEATIESRLTPEQQTNFKVVDGKYYALPHYQTFRGISYDVDLFEKRLLYFAKNKNNGNDGFVSSKTEERSLGPDGKTGTENGIDYSLDDGLPSTYDEFFELCDYMLMRNVTPFVWTGQFSDYTSYVLEAIASAYSTKAESLLSCTFDSGAETVRVVTSVNNGVPTIEEKTITNETGYYVYQLAGNYYALDFLDRIISNKNYYYSLSTNTTFSHLNAQEEFIYSSLENKPIAMLIDGSWWTNEAENSGAFSRSVADFGERAENRRFAYMPVPCKASESEVVKGGTIMKDALRSYAFINAKVKTDENKLKLAKEFLKFCYTESALQEFTVETGVPKALNYTITNEQKAQMDYFAQNLWDYRSRMEVVYSLSGNRIYRSSERTFTTDFWQANVSGKDYIAPYSALRAGVSGLDYFRGMWTSASSWSSTYGRFFD